MLDVSASKNIYASLTKASLGMGKLPFDDNTFDGKEQDSSTCARAHTHSYSFSFLLTLSRSCLPPLPLPLPLPGAISSGVFTPGHAPASSLREVDHSSVACATGAFIAAFFFFLPSFPRSPSPSSPEASSATLSSSTCTNRATTRQCTRSSRTRASGRTRATPSPIRRCRETRARRTACSGPLHGGSSRRAGLRSGLGWSTEARGRRRRRTTTKREEKNAKPTNKT